MAFNTINIFRIVGVVNILFINLTEVYSVTAAWSNHVDKWLFAILAMSFVRELIAVFVVKIEKLPRTVRIVINCITVFATGCASSIALLFPKFIYIEVNHKDNIELLRFGIEITRNYSVDELYDYLTLISVSNPIPVLTKMKISETAFNKEQIRSMYEYQVELMREEATPIVERPLNDLEVILNWCSENSTYVQIGVAVVVTAMIVGFCYYVYTHPYVDQRAAAEALLERTKGETREAVDDLRNASTTARNALDQFNRATQELERRASGLSANKGIFEDIAALKKDFAKLDDAATAGQYTSEARIAALEKQIDDIKFDIISEIAAELGPESAASAKAELLELTEQVDTIDRSVNEALTQLQRRDQVVGDIIDKKMESVKSDITKPLIDDIADLEDRLEKAFEKSATGDAVSEEVLSKFEASLSDLSEKLETLSTKFENRSELDKIDHLIKFTKETRRVTTKNINGLIDDTNALKKLCKDLLAHEKALRDCISTPSKELITYTGNIKPYLDRVDKIEPALVSLAQQFAKHQHYFESLKQCSTAASSVLSTLLLNHLEVTDEMVGFLRAYRALGVKYIRFPQESDSKMLEMLKAMFMQSHRKLGEFKGPGE